jgi:hypothetical protein
MLDELYMRDVAKSMMMPEEVLPAGKVTVSAPEPEMAGMDKAFVGTRLNVPKPGQPTQQDREKMAIGLLDTLAGALRGAAAQVGGLPGDIRSILDMINQEGAEKYLGQRSFATTEEILKDTSVRVPGTQIDVPFPPVLKESVPNRAERQKAVEVAQEVGTFLPAPGIPEAAIQGVKAVGKAIKATKNMPVGMSTQMVGQGMDELGFYSAAKQAVDAIQQPKGTGQQFLKQIEKTPGVKPDEIKWTGLDEFLQSKKSVTKAEVQEYLDKNRVQIKEVQLGGAQPAPTFTQIEPDLWESNVGNIYKQGEDDFTFIVGGEGEMHYFNSFDEAANFAKEFAKTEAGKEFADNTKFSNYTLPGGENYREILLTLPIKMVSEDEARVILNAKPNAKLSAADISFASRKKADEFESQHFDQPNILAHLRVNDRVIDGKKTLFVEEVQSDWHQAGRKKGYQKPLLTDAEKKRWNELTAKDNRNAITDADRPEFEALAEKVTAEILAKKDGVPDAPFKTTWSDLSMKRVIQMASEGGYDRIAFTTGKTQAERYDLSKQINELSYKKMDDDLTMKLGDGPYYEVVAVDKNDMPVLRKQVTEQELPDLVGKEIAKKIVDGEGKVAEDYMGKSVTKVFSGLDLQAGGEGMKGFYDDILPKFLNKYAKKWDAKTGVTEIPTSNVNIENQITFEDGKYLVDAGDGINYNSYNTKAEAIKSLGGDNPQVNYIDVTPKMRESVVTKGQPMFAIGAGGAGAAATQEENK